MRRHKASSSPELRQARRRPETPARKRRCHKLTAWCQTCTYGYDDLARIASSGCGNSVWAQNFSFDPFGNIQKTIPTGATGTAFQPSYDLTTNRITNTSPYAYDGNNGNLSADMSHNYTWDAEGKMITVDSGTSSGVCLTYDALGRMVEKGVGTSCGSSRTEIVYSPSGVKVALMNGQTLRTAFVPLPSGAQAVYNSSGLHYYRHSDWLGSSRLATTTTRTRYYDVAYAPYGEPYAANGTQDLMFTGQNQDTETSTVPGGQAGLWDFLFREQAPVQGRWLSPDPAGFSAANPADPQSWNRYAYVANRPLGDVDPLGLSDCVGEEACAKENPYVEVVTASADDVDSSIDSFNTNGCSMFSMFCAADVMPVPDFIRLLVGLSKGPKNCTPGTKGCFNVPQLCPNVPNSPPGASAAFNASLVNLETQGMWPATKLDFFYQVFKTGGPFDYKAGGADQYIDYGNWNFGYVCGANYPGLFCQSAAGANRMWRAARQGTNPFGSGLPFVKPPYGDQAADNQQIRNGIKAQGSGCVQ